MNEVICRSCARRVYAHLKGYEDLCYQCGCDKERESLYESRKTLQELIEGERDMVAKWRGNV